MVGRLNLVSRDATMCLYDYIFALCTMSCRFVLRLLLSYSCA